MLISKLHARAAGLKSLLKSFVLWFIVTIGFTHSLHAQWPGGGSLLVMLPYGTQPNPDWVNVYNAYHSDPEVYDAGFYWGMGPRLVNGQYFDQPRAY